MGMWKVLCYLDLGSKRWLRRSIEVIDETTYKVIWAREELSSLKQRQTARSDLSTVFMTLRDEDDMHCLGLYKLRGPELRGGSFKANQWFDRWNDSITLHVIVNSARDVTCRGFRDGVVKNEINCINFETMGTQCNLSKSKDPNAKRGQVQEEIYN